METRANYVLIGLFTLAVVVGVFGFVYWFQNIGGTRRARLSTACVFDGSVSGLRTGAIGAVQRHPRRRGHRSQARPAAAEAGGRRSSRSTRSVAVRADTEVGLEFQGLTGIASVSLKGGSPASPALAGDKANPPLLTAPPGATQDVTQGARDTLRRLDELHRREPGGVPQRARAIIDTFSATLARNSERIDKIARGPAKPRRRRRRQGRRDRRSGALDPHAGRSIWTSARQRSPRASRTFTAAGTKQINAIGADARRMLAEAEKTVEEHRPEPEPAAVRRRTARGEDKRGCRLRRAANNGPLRCLDRG